jgi:hypothetical protein
LRLAELLAARGDLDELRAWADAGEKDTAPADAGEKRAAWRLAELLAARGDLEQLRARADAGEKRAVRRLAELLTERGDLDQSRLEPSELGIRQRDTHVRVGIIGQAGTYERTQRQASSGSRPTFFKYDVVSLLPQDWQNDVVDVAFDADFRDFPRTPVMSREAPEVAYITRGRVRADVVQERLPWLYKLYRTEFLELAAIAWDEPIAAAFDDRYGVVLDVQRGNMMRSECCVDSNPVTGVLFFTDHPTGGELVVSHDPDAIGVAGLERDCTAIRPESGQLIFYNGRTYPHYARSLLSESEMRVVAVMNFYTGSLPESTRPSQPNRHLFGED